jgi:hypothetical protein
VPALPISAGAPYTAFMVSKLGESNNRAFGFKVIGTLTAEDMAAVSQEVEQALAGHGDPIGLLVDLSEMHGATWGARWEEMRFLQHHTARISHIAVISADRWEEVAEMVVIASAVLQGETLYFHPDETRQAWRWAKMRDHEHGTPVRLIYAGNGKFAHYTPEFTGL